MFLNKQTYVIKLIIKISSGTIKAGSFSFGSIRSFPIGVSARSATESSASVVFRFGVGAGFLTTSIRAYNEHVHCIGSFLFRRSIQTFFSTETKTEIRTCL